MSLPTNIEKLINGKTIEWERLEFKKSWNPEDVIHTMCAFANDIHNWGGGYIILGIEEQNAKPILPPLGLNENTLDDIQKKILELGYKILPNYHPRTAPYVINNQHILVIWCPAGDNRPYQAPVSLSLKNQKQAHYIRITSNTVKAKNNNLRKLNELTAHIPFDDRMNNLADIQDLNLGLIREYLQEIKSSLLQDSISMPFEALCRTMLIAKGPQEDIKPLNVGLLFFSKQPEKFFSRPWIELVWHKDDSGKNFSELYFKGPLHKQLRDCLSYFKSNIISQQVIKQANLAEPHRFYNYPFAAIEESLSNAVYHKSYELPNPIEVQIFTDKITILSYPAPMPPVTADILASEKRIIAREYRNRRIGDFLKELGLTEGRGTGFPTIYNAMKENNSPSPIFETDETNYVMVTLPIQPETKVNRPKSDQVSNQAQSIIISNINDLLEFLKGETDQVSDQVSDEVSDEVSDQVIQVLKDEISEYANTILNALLKQSLSSKEILELVGLNKHTENKKRHINPLLKYDWVTYTIPDNPKDRNQKYKLTPKGKRVAKLL